MTDNRPVHNVVADAMRTAYNAWVRDGGDLRRVKVLTGYADHARFLADCSEVHPGEETVVPTCPDIPSPYAFSMTKRVWAHAGRCVVIYETRHRRYEVFAVSGPLAVDHD